MRLHKAATGGVGGAVAATALAVTVAPRPSVAIAVGAVVTAALVRRFEPVRPYAIAGTLYVLLLALGVHLLTVVPAAWQRTPLFSLAVVGGMSTVVLVGRELLRVIVRWIVGRFVDSGDTGERVGETASAIVGTLALGWWVLRFKERLLRSGVTGVVVPATFGLDLYGVDWTVPWVLQGEVDVVVFLFVGGLVVGFHTLASWHAAMKLADDEHVRAAGAKLQRAAETAGEESKQAVQSTTETDR
jgi:hypothetical protein